MEDFSLPWTLHGFVRYLIFNSADVSESFLTEVLLCAVHPEFIDVVECVSGWKFQGAALFIGVIIWCFIIAITHCCHNCFVSVCFFTQSSQSSVEKTPNASFCPTVLFLTRYNYTSFVLAASLTQLLLTLGSLTTALRANPAFAEHLAMVDAYTCYQDATFSLMALCRSTYIASSC